MKNEPPLIQFCCNLLTLANLQPKLPQMSVAMPSFLNVIQTQLSNTKWQKQSESWVFGSLFNISDVFNICHNTFTTVGKANFILQTCLNWVRHSSLQSLLPPSSILSVSGVLRCARQFAQTVMLFMPQNRRKHGSLQILWMASSFVISCLLYKKINRHQAHLEHTNPANK